MQQPTPTPLPHMKVTLFLFFVILPPPHPSNTPYCVISYPIPTTLGHMKMTLFHSLSPRPHKTFYNNNRTVCHNIPHHTNFPHMKMTLSQVVSSTSILCRHLPAMSASTMWPWACLHNEQSQYTKHSQGNDTVEVEEEGQRTHSWAECVPSCCAWEGPRWQLSHSFPFPSVGCSPAPACWNRKHLLGQRRKREKLRQSQLVRGELARQRDAHKHKGWKKERNTKTEKNNYKDGHKLADKNWLLI